jgi:phospholipid/cholesterol/gamma-HCH transport system ATP-binding protein
LIQEITHENDITTVINTHDMNSVLEIGENIVFLQKGVKAWQGDHTQIFKTDNKAVTDFVYSSDLFKKVRDAQLKGI